MGGEEFDGFAYGHVENVAYVLAFELHFEYVVLETLAVTCLAGQHDVGHELHLHCYLACTLAFLASSAVGVEREELRCEAHLLCQWLFGHEVSYGVVCLHVGGRV